MISITFKNETDSRINLHFYGAYEDIDIEAKETRAITLYQKSVTFLVKETAFENSFFKKLFGIVLAAFVSIFLWLLNGFEKELIENQIKFPTKFEVEGLDDGIEKEIVIRESSKQFTEFDAISNGIGLDGKPEFSKDELNRQIKEYKKSKYIVMIFPCIILCALWISAIYFKSIIAVIIALVVSLLVIFFYFRNEKSDKKAIEKIRGDF